jgi:uncharacterized membrane protein YozB (DUF420 family)
LSEKRGFLNLLGIGNVIDNVKALVDTRLQIVKLELKDDLSKVLANVLISLVLLSVLIFALFLISIGLSIYFGELVNNYFYGFMLMASIYILLFILLFLVRNKIGLKEFFEKELNKLFKIDK